jgi:hypothetical protein
MPDQIVLLTRRRGLLLAALVLFLASTYMLTYSARVDSTDALFLLDATGSLLRFGDLKLDIAAGVRPPRPLALVPGQAYTLPGVNAEPLQIVLAVPLYWLAHYLPGVGLAHAMYLFNILVGAALGGMICVYALALGYAERTAGAAGVVFGLGTIFWPYSKSFFQEPLMALLLLICALLIERWRAGHYRLVGLLIGFVAMFIGAVLAKEAAAIALPALLVLMLPSLLAGFDREQRRRWLLVLALGLALCGLLLLADALGIRTRLEQFLAVSPRRLETMPAALSGYLLSIGGSFWATSPVLLLAIPGIWWLHRRRAYRYPLAALVIILSYALVYAYQQGGDWFGGLSWPPRFLIPVVPFAFLCALPVIDRALRQGTGRLLRGLVIMICLYSLWVQFSGLSLWWADYVSGLPPEAGGLGEWAGGLYDIRYLRWVIIPQLWADRLLDFAWVRLAVPGWVIVFGGLALVSLYTVWRLAISRPVRAWALAGLALVFVAAVWGGLRAIGNDPLYLGSDEDLYAALPVLEAETAPGDVVFLSDLTYHRFFLNYGKLNNPRLVSLPDHPGEQPSLEQPPQVESVNPEALLNWQSLPVIYGLTEMRDRVWLLTNSGPFIPWSVRAAERYFSQRFYPVREFTISPRVRLIEYATPRLGAPYAFRNPEYETDLIYDDRVHLQGYDLPAGIRYAPGDNVPVALYWRAGAPLDASYKVALLLRDAAGAPVADAPNTEPGAGFYPTDEWDIGVPVWDHRGLRLPPDAAPGEYQLWVVLYSQEADGAIANLPVRGAETLEGFIGVLPTRIEIES